MTDFIDRLETELLAAGARSRGARLTRKAGRGAGAGAAAVLSLAVVVGVVVVLLATGHGRRPAATAARQGSFTGVPVHFGCGNSQRAPGRTRARAARAGTQPRTLAEAAMEQAALARAILRHACTTPLTGLPICAGPKPSPSLCRVIAPIRLAAPSPSRSRARGTVMIFKTDGRLAIVIAASGMKADTAHRSDAVWLYDTPTDARLLGFVNPGVGRRGRLSTSGTLPGDAARYRKIVITVETHANPRRPGTIVLQGPLTPALSAARNGARTP